MYISKRNISTYRLQPTNKPAIYNLGTYQTESYEKQIAAKQPDGVLNNKIPHMHIYHQTHT